MSKYKYNDHWLFGNMRTSEELERDVEESRKDADSRLLKLENPCDYKVGEKYDTSYRKPYNKKTTKRTGVVVKIEWCYRKWGSKWILWVWDKRENQLIEANQYVGE